MITHAASRKHYYTVLLDRPELRLIFLRCGPAFFDECAARQSGGANPLFTLDEPFGRQAIIVEAEGIKDVFALHPAEPRNDLGLREGEQGPMCRLPLTVGGGVSME